MRGEASGEGRDEGPERSSDVDTGLSSNGLSPVSLRLEDLSLAEARQNRGASMGPPANKPLTFEKSIIPVDR
jgi:hypothetical protein